MSKNESILLVYTSNSKEYGVMSKITKSINDMTLHNEEHLSDFDEEQVVSMIYVEEDESICDAETFYHLEAISLIPRPSCSLKLKHGQINVNFFSSIAIGILLLI